MLVCHLVPPDLVEPPHERAVQEGGELLFASVVTVLTVQNVSGALSKISKKHDVDDDGPQTKRRRLRSATHDVEDSEEENSPNKSRAAWKVSLVAKHVS